MSLKASLQYVQRGSWMWHHYEDAGQPYPYNRWLDLETPWATACVRVPHGLSTVLCGPRQWGRSLRVRWQSWRTRTTPWHPWSWPRQETPRPDICVHRYRPLASTVVEGDAYIRQHCPHCGDVVVVLTEAQRQVPQVAHG